MSRIIGVNVGSQGGRSFIETARRSQIIGLAIETIADRGYAQASLAQIAKRAGISKGVISYHFAGKEELILQVITEVFTAQASFMRPKIEAESSAAGMLRAYIESSLAFIRSHRKHIIALMEIGYSFRSKDGKPRIDAAKFESAITSLEQILRWGQENGEFREFSTRVMAATIRNAVDGITPRLAAHAYLDLDSYAQELAILFDLATRR